MRGEGDENNSITSNNGKRKKKSMRKRTPRQVLTKILRGWKSEGKKGEE